MTQGARPNIDGQACVRDMGGCTIDHGDDEPGSGAWCERIIGLYEISDGQLLRLTAGRSTAPDGAVTPVVVLTAVDGSSETEVGHMLPSTAARMAAGWKSAAAAATGRTVGRYAS